MAVRFRFKLEAVRRLRRRAEEAQQRVVAARMGDWLARRRRVERMQETLMAETRAARADQRAPMLDIPSLRARVLFMSRLDVHIADARRDARRVEAALDEERGKLAVASARRKALDTLRERHWHRYARALARAEQAESDELATVGYLRRTAGDETARVTDGIRAARDEGVTGGA